MGFYDKLKLEKVIPDVTVELTAKEQLEDMGFELIFTEERDGIDKLPFFVTFYSDGHWDVMTISHTEVDVINEDGTIEKRIYSGGGGSDLDSGDNLISILPILKEIRDLYLKSLTETQKIIKSEK